jgi:DNA topoisomerase-1
VALKLLSLPRELGTGEDGEPILANVGRFGPYVKQGTEFRSLEDTDDVYSIALERARELLAQPKKSMRRARQAPKELKALGKHPENGEPVRVLDGRYGPYVTDGTTNASVPKGMQVEALTMEAAVELLRAREGMGGSKKAKGRGPKFKAVKAAPKKKAAAKKKTA